MLYRLVFHIHNSRINNVHDSYQQRVYLIHISFHISFKQNIFETARMIHVFYGKKKSIIYCILNFQKFKFSFQNNNFDFHDYLCLS